MTQNGINMNNHYLGLGGKEDLNLIIEYLLDSDIVEQRHKDKFLNNELIPEYVTYEENEYYFTYHFHLVSRPAVLDMTFDKQGYYNWVKPILRRRKLEKIMNNKCNHPLDLFFWT